MTGDAHRRYDRDERRLLDTAQQELWTSPLLDAVIDVAPDVLGALTWQRVPDEASPGWASRSTAMLGLAAMGLRATRIVALAVRSGYGPEGFGNLRRVLEAAGHSVNVANDESGQYAANWLAQRGRAGRPRTAFDNTPEQDAIWRLMSGLVHATFADFTNLSADIDADGRLIHRVGPQRAITVDNAALWLAGRQLGRILAAVLRLRPEAPQSAFLQAVSPLIAGEDRLASELADLASQRQQRGNAEPKSPG